jgi:hypothetical protein
MDFDLPEEIFLINNDEEFRIWLSDLKIRAKLQLHNTQIEGTT